MPWLRPSLTDLKDRIAADFKAELEIAGSIARRAVTLVLSKVWAGGVHLLHGFLAYMARQLFIATAEDEFLLRRADPYGIFPTPATFAAGTVTATGVDSSVIPEDTILVRDDEFTYSVTADATITGGTATVSVIAVEAGAAGNLAPAETLQLESPIVGVDPTMTVDVGDGDGIDGGLDQGSVESVRQRLRLRLQKPPQGGSDQDYEQWSLEVPGVTRAWVYRHENGLGTVVVRFVRDNESPIFPDAGEVAAVQAKLDSERPTTAEVTAVAPVEQQQAFTIALDPDTTAIRTAVTEELGDLFTRLAEPGDGAGRGEIKISKMRTAIGLAVEAAGGVDADYTLSFPSTDVTPPLGNLLTLGTITWV